MAISTSGKRQVQTLTGQLRVEQNDGRIVVYDPVAGVTRLVLGILPDGTVGLVISKPGEDVFDAYTE